MIIYKDNIFTCSYISRILECWKLFLCSIRYLCVSFCTSALQISLNSWFMLHVKVGNIAVVDILFVYNRKVT